MANFKNKLYKLLPREFQKIQQLLDLFENVGAELDWLNDDYIQKLPDLLNPDKVNRAYLNYLADLVGAVFDQRDIDENENRIRRYLKESLWLNKRKGTYAIIRMVIFLRGFYANIYNLWTTDYEHFVRVLAPDFSSAFIRALFSDSGYYSDEYLYTDYGFYQTPHFDVELLLNYATPYWNEDEGYYELIDYQKMNQVQLDVIRVKSIKQFPHFYELLVFDTPDDGKISENLKIKSKSRIIQANWFPAVNNRDIVGIKFGTGKKNLDLTNAYVEEEVVGGYLLDVKYDVYPSKVIIHGRLPHEIDETEKGISEIGLYDSSDRCIYITCFPSVKKSKDFAFDVDITVRSNVMSGKVLISGEV